MALKRAVICLLAGTLFVLVTLLFGAGISFMTNSTGVREQIHKNRTVALSFSTRLNTVADTYSSYTIPKTVPYSSQSFPDPSNFTTKSHRSATRTRLENRAPRDPKTWDQCVCSGSRLLEKIRSQQGETGKGFKFEDFQKTGYTWKVRQDEKPEPNLDAALLEFGIPIGPHYTEVQIEYDHATTNDEDDAFFRFTLGYNPGFIQVGSSYVSQALDNTKLKQFNDILWLTWEKIGRDTNSDVSDLQYFMVANMNNAGSKQVAQRVLREQRKKISAWPGVEVAADSEHGKALLGTPNCVALGWMLVYNRGVFKGRGPVSVHLFGSTDGMPSVVWKIGEL